ncbi:GtrA family protein [Actinomycetospora flava]|uniref:GtrA family protein n=1 Tax=Actinomycetospora flava TaxID=3129232 RepID=A0ABU8MBR6_9PSEU
MTAETRAHGLVAAGARYLTAGLVVLPLSLGLHLVLVRAGVDVHLARVLSFVTGTALISVLHRRWTFRSRGVRGAAGWMVLLSATTFAVVVLTHGLALAALPALLEEAWVVPAAWFVSQGVGTTVTFLVLRGAVLR